VRWCLGPSINVKSFDLVFLFIFFFFAELSFKKMVEKRGEKKKGANAKFPDRTKMSSYFIFWGINFSKNIKSSGFVFLFFLLN